jgi:hypothetical protein
MKKDTAALLYLSSEFIFILLPIVILTVVRILEGQYLSIIINYEWSIAAIILFGQSITKLTSGISNTSNKARWQVTALLISVIIVIGLIPSTVVLLDFMNNEYPSQVSIWLQPIIFLISSVCFFLIGGVGQSLLDDKH